MKQTLTIDQEIQKAIVSAQDKLLDQANFILKNSNPKNGLKAKPDKELISNLVKIGFVNQEDVKTFKFSENDIYKAEKTVRLIEYYKKQYPKNRFIDEDSIKSICNQFGLLFAPVDMYSSDIPLENMKEIVGFKCKVSDKRFRTKVSFTSKKASKIITGEKLKNSLVKVSVFMDDLYKSDLFGFFKDKYFERLKAVAENMNQIYGTELMWYHIEGFMQEEIKSNVLSDAMIIAPKDKFNIPKNYSVEKGFEVGFKKIVKIKDPVVLQPVKGGFLIVSAWGFEETLPEISGIPQSKIQSNLN